jgi:nicotinamide-nucleotide amidase
MPQMVAGLLADALLRHRWRLVSAESCTGGLIAAACTDLPGSSDWFERGFVTYSNDSKTEMLDVPAPTILQYGAVSEEVVRAMAQGALQRSRAQVALAVSGVAGPGGGSASKPVGTVWFAWSTPAGLQSQLQCFAGDRAAVRAAAVRHALKRLCDVLLDAT